MPSVLDQVDSEKETAREAAEDLLRRASGKQARICQVNSTSWITMKCYAYSCAIRWSERDFLLYESFWDRQPADSPARRRALSRPVPPIDVYSGAGIIWAEARGPAVGEGRGERRRRPASPVEGAQQRGSRGASRASHPRQILPVTRTLRERPNAGRLRRGRCPMSHLR